MLSVSEYTGRDPAGFVVSLNLHRRHLSESRRAMVAARLATMKQGARTDISPIGGTSQSEAASMLNVGKRSVERAREVLEDGAPELVATVEQGRVSVSAAADVATLSHGGDRKSPIGDLKQSEAASMLNVAKRLANMSQGQRTDIQPSANLQKVSQADAARLATLQDGQRKSASPIGEAVSQSEAASMLNVGKRSVERGAKLKAWHAVRAKERQIASLKKGAAPVPANLPGRAEGDARDHAAKAVGVGGKLIDQAENVMRKAVPRLRPALDFTGAGAPDRARIDERVRGGIDLPERH